MRSKLLTRVPFQIERKPVCRDTHIAKFIPNIWLYNACGTREHGTHENVVRVYSAGISTSRHIHERAIVQTGAWKIAQRWTICMQHRADHKIQTSISSAEKSVKRRRKHEIDIILIFANAIPYQPNFTSRSRRMRNHSLRVFTINRSGLETLTIWCIFRNYRCVVLGCVAEPI